VTSERRLLATDLDGTFIGDDDASRALWSDLDAADIHVVFSTGRHLRSILDFDDQLDTPRRPVACVAMVGTEVWFRDGDGFRRDHTFTDAIVEGWDIDRVSEVVADRLDAELQPAEWQSELKRSWFVAPGSDSTARELAHLLDGEGLAVKLVHSHDRFLDAIPARAGKGQAVRHVAERLGVDAAHVVTAGDTGNDLDMMRPELGFRSIVVGNATPELAALDGPHVFHATARFAAGIEEGLVHHGWLSS
jgi:sucrose-6F-phosphate phosphohydrolase